MKILIIEDEIKTARELKKNIEKVFDEAIVLNILSGVHESIKWLKENAAPDLIFSDIQLSDGLSFEIFKNVEVQVPIIFCTAYDEYAIEAFKTAGIDYLLKPIDDEKLMKSINKYKALKQAFKGADVFQNNMQSLLHNLSINNYKKTILVYQQDKIIPVKTDNIAFFHYELGNIYFVTFDQKKYFIKQTLDEFESTLNPDMFFRANRQFIVHKAAILNIENYFTRRLLVKLQMPVAEDIIVSKTKSPLFLKWIENV